MTAAQQEPRPVVVGVVLVIPLDRAPLPGSEPAGADGLVALS